MRTAGAIDVHAHFLPESYRAALLGSGHEHPDGFAQIPAWSAEEHVAAMDRLGIATSLLSISSPGVYFGDEAMTRERAREVNEVGRRAVVDHPGRFGLLAALPLPDIDAAMAEIDYCCDRLNVDGFAVLTNIGGTYLGDYPFTPEFAAAMAGDQLAGVGDSSGSLLDALRTNTQRLFPALGNDRR